MTAVAPRSPAARRDDRSRKTATDRETDPGKPEAALPHERDEGATRTSGPVDPKVAQAAKDLDAGQVDTDLRATPGLDAARRRGMVRGGGTGSGSGGTGR
jgi:hypothetical protein